MRRIKIGQIGICHEHAAAKLHTVRSLPDIFEVVGVVDDRATTAARFSGDDLSAYEGVTWLSEQELLDFPGLQAVLIETPNSDLVPTAIRTLRHNLPIHMDKPAGEDMRQFRELLHGCRTRNLPLQMGYMFRNNPAMQWCRRAVRDHWIGEIFEIQVSMSHRYGGDAYQHYLSNYKGGIMFNLGCHLIDLVVTLLGPPDRVTPFLQSTPGYDSSVKNNCQVVLQYPHALVTLRACSAEVDGLNRRNLKICGTRGTIQLSPLERFDGRPLKLQLTLLEAGHGFSAGTQLLDFGITKDRYEGQFLEFAEIIRGHMDNPYTYDHDELVHKVVLAASGYCAWDSHQGGAPCV